MTEPLDPGFGPPIAGTERLVAGALRSAWRTYWSAVGKYHRYEVEGFEHLLGPRPVMIAGYHGRPVAFDLAILSVEIEARLGYLPHGFVHTGWHSNPALRFLGRTLGASTGDDQTLAEAVRRGEHVIVTPGGSRESMRPWRERYRVSWGERIGYLKIALKYRLPIVPVACDGVDDAFFALFDGYRLGRRLDLPYRLDAGLFFGPTGVWPLSLPFPVRFRQRIGAPIDLPEALSPEDRGGLLAEHHRVTRAVQELLDRLRARRGEAPGAPLS